MCRVCISSKTSSIAWRVPASGVLTSLLASLCRWQHCSMAWRAPSLSVERRRAHPGGMWSISSRKASSIARSSDEVLDSIDLALDGIRFAPADMTARKTLGSSASNNTQAADRRGRASGAMSCRVPTGALRKCRSRAKSLSKLRPHTHPYGSGSPIVFTSDHESASILSEPRSATSAVYDLSSSTVLLIPARTAWVAGSHTIFGARAS